MNQPLFFYSDLTSPVETIAADAILSRTIYRNEALRAILFTFAPGQELSEHATPLAAILQILQGEATLTLGEQTMDVKAGAWVSMSPDLRHSVYSALSSINTFTP